MGTITFEANAFDLPIASPHKPQAASEKADKVEAPAPKYAAKSASSHAIKSQSADLTAKTIEAPELIRDQDTTGPDEDHLLSSAAGASASSAFESLSSLVLSHSPRTLDDLVQDMLRPLLKSWLDEHLPTLVEKLVQAEIKRISRTNR